MDVDPYDNPSPSPMDTGQYLPSGSDRGISSVIDASPIHHPAPHQLSRRLSRSPKRVRSTPPTADTLVLPTHAPLTRPTSVTSSRQQEWTRPTLSTRRGVSYESPHDNEHEQQHAKTSPWSSRRHGGDLDDASGWGLSTGNNFRRREMSVPLVSDRVCETPWQCRNRSASWVLLGMEGAQHL